MKNILHHLFYGNLHEFDKSLKEFHNTKEFQDMDASHAAFEKTLNEQQLKLFDEYYLAESGFLGLDKERTYIDDFKTGFWLALELMDFDINI